MNLVWLWLRKANQGPEDRMVNPVFQALMVHRHHQTIKTLTSHNRREKISCLLCFNVAHFAPQVILVNLGSLVFQVYQGPRVTLDSQVLDYQDPPEPKVPMCLFFCNLKV